MIFAQVLAARPPAERHWLAGKVAVFSAIVLLISLWAGSYVLNFFGISLGALRLGGGLVVAQRAWQLLNAPEESQARKEQQAEPARLTADAAFFPLTMPLTTGPGAISVAVALSAERPETHGVLMFMAGLSAAALAICLMVWGGLPLRRRRHCRARSRWCARDEPAGGLSAAVHWRADHGERGGGYRARFCRRARHALKQRQVLGKMSQNEA